MSGLIAMVASLAFLLPEPMPIPRHRASAFSSDPVFLKRKEERRAKAKEAKKARKKNRRK